MFEDLFQKDGEYSLQEVMDTTAQMPIIVWAAPIMIALVLAEYFLSQYQKRDNYDGKDILASAGVGIGNLITTAFTKTVMFGLVLFFYQITPLRIPPTWWSFILCLITLDFFRYWAHRFAHEQRFLWSSHVVHHSSPKYNFSVSFRLSWFQQIKLIFFLPVAFLGFDPIIFFIVHQIEVLYQFWIHTEYIKKLPKPIEYIFTTPSHHRVHHASAPQKYLDKNYGSTFIIWDRMFGTFQQEEERATYGITKPVNSYNPFYLVFHELIDIFRDLGRARNPRQVWKTFFGPPQ